MSHVEMTQKQKGARTQITDLPEITVELSENELRIVSGGLRPIHSCYANNASASMISGESNVATGQDWDSD
jgi:hypothetical protein